MNSHLNIFKTYTNSQRSYQLENDLTRAFAISLQEDSLFFHEILKEVFKGTKFYSQLFDSLESETTISIDIQKRTSQLFEYEHIFAITLSEAEIGDFWGAKNDRNYDPICDLVIKVNDVYLIIEAKRDNYDCTAQLYNQVLNVISSDEANTNSLNEKEHGKVITPFDLNWAKLMAIAVKVLSFEKSFGNTNRFLADFVSLVKSHNYRWLPESPINSLQSNNKNSIFRRIDSAIIEASKIDSSITKLHYNDRLGIEFNKGWAQEILFNINKNGDLIVAIYPGNTKAQGHSLFKANPVFSQNISILDETYSVTKTYHIKFTSFQKYFTGLWFGDNVLNSDLYTRNNFYKFTGRKKRGKDWDEIEALFDNSLNFDWKNECKWNNKIINSGKNQFDISFGYELVVEIPFEKLKELDIVQSDLTKLTELIKNISNEFRDNLLNTSA
ncbi:hypothetical protein P8625_02170 [Tenacibaculum tangerinum]|uniref:PD-(D/E)XK nuclease superfamily protein n=1 Tax=Tenacibaculum tangerinum TaxID=3038772 RepID=A0ABY8L7R2_9FLAO|nr:hypothetical protein [Tenacibaculum tangerinum]WGH75995.1 hypothetical protein P8625_02170 [Tenacibaculum tangerinum]